MKDGRQQRNTWLVEAMGHSSSSTSCQRAPTRGRGVASPSMYERGVDRSRCCSAAAPPLSSAASKGLDGERSEEAVRCVGDNDTVTSCQRQRHIGWLRMMGAMNRAHMYSVTPSYLGLRNPSASAMANQMGFGHDCYLHD